MRRRITYLLPLIGIILFLYIIWRTGLANILSIFPGIKLGYLLVALIMLVGIFLLKGLKWRIILDYFGVDYSLLKTSKIWYIGYFIGTVTPAKLGDFIRVFYIKKDTRKKVGECFLTVFLDRLFDIVTILLLALASIVLFVSFFKTNLSIGVIIFVIIALLLGAYLVTKKNFVRFLLKPFFNMLIPESKREKIKINFNSFYDNLRKVNKRLFFIAFIVTLITWLLNFLYAYVLAVALNINVSLGYIFLIMPMVTIIELIPISISGLGTREAALIFFFFIIGISEVLAVSFSLLYVFGSLLLALLGAYFLFKNPIR